MLALFSYVGMDEAARVHVKLPYNANVRGTVSAVEYQGPLVRVALHTESGDEAVALLPDNIFRAHPVAIGQATTLLWAPSDVHMLERP